MYSAYKPRLSPDRSTLQYHLHSHTTKNNPKYSPAKNAASRTYSTMITKRPQFKQSEIEPFYLEINTPSFDTKQNMSILDYSNIEIQTPSYSDAFSSNGSRNIQSKLAKKQCLQEKFIQNNQKKQECKESRTKKYFHREQKIKKALLKKQLQQIYKGNFKIRKYQ